MLPKTGINLSWMMRGEALCVGALRAVHRAAANYRKNLFKGIL